MLIELAFVIETITIVICLDRIYGRKIRLDIPMILFVFLSVFIEKVLEVTGFDEINTMIFMAILFVLCKFRFKESWMETGISIVLLSVIITLCQFLCVLIMSLIISNDEVLRCVLVNIEVLCFSIFLLPKFKLNVFKKSINLQNKYIISVFIIITGTVLYILLQNKLFHRIRADRFILLVPAVIVLGFMYAKWNNSQKIIEKLEKEKYHDMCMQKRYDEILKEIRLKQHALKNHLAAIFSTHHTYKTYEQLVYAQGKYCNKLVEEHKYNNVLLIGNTILSSFLYDKFKEIEDEGISLEYRISTKLENLSIPTYHMVEIMGILMDNAKEALNDMEEKFVSVELTENQQACFFTIRNTYRYVSYA